MLKSEEMTNTELKVIKTIFHQISYSIHNWKIVLIIYNVRVMAQMFKWHKIQHEAVDLSEVDKHANR